MLCFVILPLHFPAFVPKKKVSAIFSTRKQRRLLLSHTWRHIGPRTYWLNQQRQTKWKSYLPLAHYLGGAAGRNHGRGGLEEPLQVAPPRRSIAGGEPSARTCRHLRSLPSARAWNRGSESLLLVVVDVRCLQGGFWAVQWRVDTANLCY